jgi:hypothetical protein
MLGANVQHGTTKVSDATLGVVAGGLDKAGDVLDAGADALHFGASTAHDAAASAEHHRTTSPSREQLPTATM